MVTVPKIDFVEFLVNRKFRRLAPPLNAMAKALLHDGLFLGDDDEEWTPPTSDTLKRAEEFREALSALTKPEIRKLYGEELAKQHLENDQRRIFSQSYADADFDYWAKMADWTLDEAIALSFGKNPSVVSWTALEKIPAYLSPFVRKYGARRELALRALKWKKLYDPVLPPIFIDWVKKTNISFPDELAEKVGAIDGGWVDWKTQYKELLKTSRTDLASANEINEHKNQTIRDLENAKPEVKSLHTKERETLLKLIIGMAIDGYGYVPGAPRSPTSKEIADALAEKGISLEQDTVRKWLKEAAELLPQDSETPDS